MFGDGRKWFGMTGNGQGWLEMAGDVQNGQGWPEKAEDGRKWAKWLTGRPLIGFSSPTNLMLCALRFFRISLYLMYREKTSHVLWH